MKPSVRLFCHLDCEHARPLFARYSYFCPKRGSTRINGQTVEHAHDNGEPCPHFEPFEQRK